MGAARKVSPGSCYIELLWGSWKAFKEGRGLSEVGMTDLGMGQARARARI